MKRLCTFALLLAAAVALSPAVSAAPTPEPGGANEVAAVTAGFGVNAFNGQLRFKPLSLETPPAADYPASAGQRWLLFKALVSNGMKKPYGALQPTATIASADGTTLQAQPDKVLPVGGNFNVPPGAAWQQQVYFQVPASFVPVKILMVYPDTHYKAFRITVTPADLPKT